MNARTGKILTLLGFGGLTLIVCIEFLSAWLLPLGGLSFIFSFFRILCYLAVAAGFGIVFLDDRAPIYILIAGGFIAPILSTFISRFNLPMSLLSICNILTALLCMAAVFAWALKLWQDDNRLAAILAVGGICVSFFVSFFVTLLWGMFPQTYNAMTRVLPSLANIAEMGMLAVAAFLDFQKE